MCGRSVWKQPAYNVKNPPTHIFIKPINHKQSLQTSCFRFSLCARHWGGKVPPICDTLCPISINTALSEKLQSAITGDIQCQHQRGFTSVVFWDALMNIGVAIISSHLSQGHCGYISFLKEISRKKSVTSPKCLGINTNASCENVSSRQSKYHAFVFQIAFLKELLGTL